MAASFDSALQRCSGLAEAKQLHAHLLATGLFQTVASLRVKLLERSAISPSADLAYAAAVLATVRRPTTNDWNALLRGHAASPLPRAALLLYRSLLRSAQRPDALSLSFALKASARLSALSESSQLHAHILRLGFSPDVLLLTTLVDAYSKAARLDDAERAFDGMPRRDVATWNALINGFAQGSRPHDALTLFRRICRPDSPERPNEVTVIGALSACAQLGALSDGVAAHAHATSEGLDTDVRVRNALVDMYAKCGSLDRALAIFRSIPDKTLVSWNATIMGLAMHGHGARALELFNEMVSTPGGPRPDAVTYLAVLCGCNHAGLVDEGLRIFCAMPTDVTPNVKHYGCIVDLLGRAGRLGEAYSVVTSINTVEPDVVLWQTLLGACKTYRDVDLAEHVSQRLLAMGSGGCGDYVLLSNVYAAQRRWRDVDRVREEMRQNDVRKVPGFSFMELDGVVHRFLNGDREHEKWREIYSTLEEMATRIRALGFVPEASYVLHDIGEEDKEQALWHHSEKLAIAFGMVSTPPSVPIQVIKNLRICGDCHTVAKLVSKAYQRVIVIRDRARFHRFEGGNCSCGDYW